MTLNGLTEHLELLTTTHSTRSSSGRGRGSKLELTGIKKLRELILDLAVRGKLVPQNLEDEPASILLERIAAEKAQLVKEKKIKKQKPLPPVAEDEKPFELPAGWEWVRLSDLSVLENGDRSKNYPNKSLLVESGIPFVNAGHLSNGRIDTSEMTFITEDRFNLLKAGKFKEGDILYCLRGSLGKCAVVDSDLAGAIASSLVIIRLCGDMSADYLMHYFNSRLSASMIKKYDNGTAQPNLSASDLAKFAVPLPPAQERRWIVTKVNELMTLCDQLEQDETDSIAAHQTLVDTMLTTLADSKNAGELAENWSLVAQHFDTLFTTDHSIEQLKQTILQLAVMGRLVPQDASDEPASVLLERIATEKARLVKEKKIKRQKPLPAITDVDMPFQLPIGWSWARLEDVVDIHSGITKGRKLADRKLVSVPYLRVANVQRAHLVLDEIKEVEIPVEEKDKYQVKARDLLITEGGDWDKVGRTAIWSDELPYMAHQNHVFKARIFLPEQSELWLERYLNGPVARRYFAQSSKQTTNLASINKTQLRCCPVAIPPYEEKDRIVTRVNELMTLCNTLQQQVHQTQTTQQQLSSALVEQALA